MASVFLANVALGLMAPSHRICRRKTILIVCYLWYDDDPVEYARCNILIQNYDEFLETFGIQEGDGMYLAPEERIAIW